MRISKRWLKKNFMSVVTEWKSGRAIMDSTASTVFTVGMVQSDSATLGEKYMLMTLAVLSVLQLVRRVMKVW